MLLGSKLLALVKCILLERKVIAFTTGSAARLSTFVLTVATLIPGLVHSLGTGTVSFHTSPGAITKADWAAHGLPLSVYSHVRALAPIVDAPARPFADARGDASQGLFQPYFSLMQLDELTTAASAFVGCNNLVIRQSKTVGTDVVVDVRPPFSFSSPSLPLFVPRQLTRSFDSLTRAPWKLPTAR